MIFRASVIFLTYLICNLVTLFIIYVPQLIIDLCYQGRQISLTYDASTTLLLVKIYTSVLNLSMDRLLLFFVVLICSIKIICGAVSGILGAISWKNFWAYSSMLWYFSVPLSAFYWHRCLWYLS